MPENLDEQLEQRWQAANAALDELRRTGRLNPDDPSEREQELLAELDHVEYDTDLLQRMRNQIT